MTMMTQAPDRGKSVSSKRRRPNWEPYMEEPIRLPRMPLDMLPGTTEAAEFYKRTDAGVALVRTMSVRNKAGN